MNPPAGIRERAPARGAGAVHGLLSLLGVYLLVIGLFVLGWLMFPDRFVTLKNLMNVLRAVALLGIVSVGVAFVTHSRHYVDLSVPGIMALSGIVAISALPWGFAASLAAGMAAGLCVGIINGLVIGYLRLNPIIWTLAMMSVLSGVIRRAYGGRQVYPEKATAAGRAFLDLYHIEVCQIELHLQSGTLSFPVPLIVVILVVLAVAAALLMRKTGFGARLTLTGSAYEVARMTGINVRRTVASAFVISAVTSAVAGILLTSFNKVGASYIGRGYDFAAITAVVIGGVTLAGGRGGIAGVIGGVLVIGLMSNVMSLVAKEDFGFVIGEFEKAIVQGVLFIVVVGVNSALRRKSGMDDE